MTDFIYWLGDFFNAFFAIFEKAGNIPNYAFIALGFLMLIWWLGLQKKYSDKAKKDGTLM